MRKLTTTEFVSKAIETHDNFYDYSEAIYDGTHHKLIILCPIHGTFSQTPHAHIGKQKQGCPKCYGRDKSSEEFVILSRKTHSSKYDYSKVRYKRCNQPVIITCPKHGDFHQLPLNHLKGKGCPTCSHIISVAETEFLNYLGIGVRNHRLPEWKYKAVDGIDGNIVYEFLGDYWHGNLEKFDPDDFHPKRKITYGELNRETMNILRKIKSLGYEVRYIWENDWNKFGNKITAVPKIISL